MNPASRRSFFEMTSTSASIFAGAANIFDFEAGAATKSPSCDIVFTGLMLKSAFSAPSGDAIRRRLP